MKLIFEIYSKPAFLNLNVILHFFLSPVIACAPSPLPYLPAVLPTDIDMEDMTDTPTSASSRPPAASELRLGEDNADSQMDAETIDNPYLQPAKIAKKKWR